MSNDDASAGRKPRITVTYCRKCHFLPRATWVAQELLHTYQDYVESVAVVPGEGGQFDIAVDGEVVFANQQEARFPEMRELRERIARYVEGAPKGRHAGET
jgi:selenoprotein W-related protein